MGLMDFASSLATKFGPSLLAAGQRALGPGPSAGFAAGYQAPGRPTAAAAMNGEFAPRRRRAGLTARDIKGAQKVARVVQAFGYKPKIQHRKKRR